MGSPVGYCVGKGLVGCSVGDGTGTGVGTNDGCDETGVPVGLELLVGAGTRFSPSIA